MPQAMRQRIRDSRHMWTYEYMAQYVTEKVAATAGDPELGVYRANDTICEAGNYTTVRVKALFQVSGDCICLPILCANLASRQTRARGPHGFERQNVKPLGSVCVPSRCR